MYHITEHHGVKGTDDPLPLDLNFTSSGLDTGDVTYGTLLGKNDLVMLEIKYNLIEEVSKDKGCNPINTRWYLEGSHEKVNQNHRLGGWNSKTGTKVLHQIL